MDDGLSLTWRQIRRFRIQLACGLLVITFLLYLPAVDGLFGTKAFRFVEALLPNLATALIIYLVIELVVAKAGFSAVDELRERVAKRVVESVSPAPGVTGIYSQLNQVPWTSLFATATSVDIVARFFDGPLDLAGEDTLAAFFERGGRVRVIIPDPALEALMREATEQRELSSKYHHEDVKQRLMSSLRRLQNARLRAGNPSGHCTTYAVDTLINYAGYCFDGATLLLSPYEHATEYGKRAPRFKIDLPLAPEIQEFWDHEIRVLTREDWRRDDLLKAK